MKPDIADKAGGSDRREEDRHCTTQSLDWEWRVISLNQTGKGIPAEAGIAKAVRHPRER